MDESRIFELEKRIFELEKRIFELEKENTQVKQENKMLKTFIDFSRNENHIGKCDNCGIKGRTHGKLIEKLGYDKDTHSYRGIFKGMCPDCGHTWIIEKTYYEM